MAELSKKIMRRIYWAFFLRKATHPVFVHATLLVISIFALSRIISIPSILANIMEVKVGEVFTYLVDALFNTQLATIVWLSVIAAIVVSLIWHTFKDREFEVRKTEWV